MLLLVPVPLVPPVVVVLGVVVLGVVVLGVVVLGVVVLGVVVVGVVVLDVTGGIDRKLVASGPANCGVPKMNVLELEPVVVVRAGVVRVIATDEVDTPDGIGTSSGVSTLAAGAATAVVVGVVGVVVVGVVVVVVGVVVVGVVVVGVVVLGVVVVGVVVLGVVVLGVVVVGVVVVGVAICAKLKPEVAERAMTAIEARVISDNSLVSCMANLPGFRSITETCSPFR